MAKKSDLTDGELIARVEALEKASYGIFDAELTEQRRLAFNYYNGAPFGNEIEGRSQVVSRDVLDTIESALPQLLKVFVSGDEVVKFMPRGPEDEKAAEQETAAVNYYAMEKNDFFPIAYTWFKDALLSKNGYVKVYWEEEDEVETESYQGLTDDQLTLLLQDERVEVIAHSGYPDQSWQGGNAAQMMQAGAPALQAPMLHDVKIQVTEKRGCIKIENVAPEDILVGVNTRTVALRCADFVQHRALMTRAEIEEQGWKVPEGASLGDDSTQWEEANARNLYGETQESFNFEEYLVKDTYMTVDGELNRLVIIGNEIVLREDEDIVIPFAVITPHIMPHRHVGMSYSDITEDIQLIKSTLLRGQLDAMYLANQPRFAISDNVNLEDMLTSRPGGVVRVKGDPGGNVMPLVTPTFPQTSFQLVEYLDSAKERRTGVTAYNQGLDANSLNKTATGVSQIMQATQQRIELVARCFANTGIKELFTLVHRLVRKYNTRPDIIRIRNEWVTVDPREWKERKDLSIAVGLGTGNKDQQLMHLGALYQQQVQLLQLGVPCVTPENVYETLRQTVMNSGFKQPEQFVTDPQKIPPKPPQQDPKIALKQMELQADQQKFQAETIVKQQESDKAAQMDIHKFQAQVEIDKQKADRVWQQEQLRSQNDVVIEREKIAAQMELERYKAELKAQTDLQIAQIQAEMQARELQGKFAIESQKSDMEQKRHEEQIAAMNRPKKVVKGPDGRVAGIE